MNDAEVRGSFHSKMLRRHHEDPTALVIDELGLHHGACRADIAVVNGRLLGFEIKSDADALSRLPSQIAAYNCVFDRITVVVGDRHLTAVRGMVPEWWGIVRCVRGGRGGVSFSTWRRPLCNPLVDPLSVAQLLWRAEAVEILRTRGEHPRALRQPRGALYARLVETMDRNELAQAVRRCLMCRTSWRGPQQPSRGGGSSRPTAT